MSTPTIDTNGAAGHPEVDVITTDPPDPVVHGSEDYQAPIIESAPPSGGVSPQNADLRLFRCDILELDRLAEAVRTGAARFEDIGDHIVKVREHAEGVLTALEGFTGTPQLSKELLRTLRLSWDRLRQVPVIAEPTKAEADAQRRLAQLNQVSSVSRELIYAIGYQTIPSRLNEWLKKAPVGYYVPFHTVFADEVPNEEDRTKILQFIAFQPTEVRNGLVDAANGLIYRFDPRPGRHWWSVFRILAAVAVLTAVVANWGQLSRLTDKWPFVPGDWFDLTLIWFSVLAGVVVHLVVGAAKRIREQRALPPVFATNEVLKRINAREGLIHIKLATALIGFFALLAADSLTNIEPLTAFLAGYALDSVVGLFTTSLDSQAAAQSDLLKQKLKVTTP